jgi:hypothetical protein
MVERSSLRALLLIFILEGCSQSIRPRRRTVTDSRDHERTALHISANDADTEDGGRSIWTIGIGRVLQIFLQSHYDAVRCFDFLNSKPI